MVSGVLGTGTGHADVTGTPTQVHPELETVVRMMRIGGDTEDSSIVVIENPLVAGYTGLLLSRAFRPGHMEVTLEGVLHVRESGFIVEGVPDEYEEVTIKSSTGYNCNIVVAGGCSRERRILPNPNLIPYALCFIPRQMPGVSSQRSLQLAYERFYDGISYDSLHEALSKPGDRSDVLKSLYRLYARAVPGFSLGRNRGLITPRNYASLRPGIV